MTGETFEKATARVQALLNRTFPNAYWLRDRWMLPLEGAFIYVRVRQEKAPPGMHSPPVVKVFSALLKEVPKTTNLLDHLNTLNSRIAVGRVYWDGGLIMLETTLLAETLRQFELEASVSAVSDFAGDYAPRLQDAYGGQPPFAE